MIWTTRAGAWVRCRDPIANVTAASMFESLAGKLKEFLRGATRRVPSIRLLSTGA
jgi:hypothetical protein